MKVTIYESNGKFDVYAEGNKFIRRFGSEGEAVLFCKQNNLHLIDVFFEVLLSC
jgi:hypothetical protein